MNKMISENEIIINSLFKKLNKNLLNIFEKVDKGDISGKSIEKIIFDFGMQVAKETYEKLLEKVNEKINDHPKRKKEYEIKDTKTKEITTLMGNIQITRKRI